MSQSLHQVVLSALEWLPRDRDLQGRGRRFWAVCSVLLLLEVGLLWAMIRYIPFTNIDYRAYIQQSRKFQNLLPSSKQFDVHSDVVQDFASWSLSERWARSTKALFRIGGVRMEERYSLLTGETGPLVYPALHLYIYTIIDIFRPLPSHLLFSGSVDPSNPTLIHMISDSEDTKTILPLQWGWAVLYLVTMGMVMWIYRKAGKARAMDDVGQQKKVVDHPQAPRPTALSSIPSLVFATLNSPAQIIYLLPLLMLSKRLHSIYVFRLFNDPWAMFLLYGSVILMMQHRWKAGSVVFSLAIGVKMNILLYLPGLLVLLFQYEGVLGSIICVAIIFATQILLPAPFFFGNKELALDYFGSAFEFSRKFTYKESVNLAFLSKEVFDGDLVSTVLLGLHALLLVAFAWFKWSKAVRGGTMEVLRRGLLGSWMKAPVPRSMTSQYHIPLVLFTSNLIGILCARSLHYQFNAWYAHQIPLLLWFSRARLWVCLLLWLAIQYVWNSYPSTGPASLLLLGAHCSLLACIFVNT